MNALSGAASDAFVVARRNVIKIVRVPEVLVFVLIQPILFVLLFAYVFGGSIEIPGVSYREFLIAGIFAQTVVFGATFTGAGIAEDMTKGIMDRFRSLPMSRSAVLVGRTLSDVVYNVLSLFVMAIAGLIVGWRMRGSLVDAIIAFALILFFAYAISWIMALVGLVVPSQEVVQNAAFIFIFPMTFIANTFVPSDDLPGPLKAFAEWNPVSTVTQVGRERFGNLPEGAPEPTAWPLQNPEIYTLIVSIGIIAVFAPLAIRRFNRAGS